MYIDILAASVYKHSPEGTASVYKCRVAYKQADIYKLLDSWNDEKLKLTLTRICCINVSRRLSQIDYVK